MIILTCLAVLFAIFFFIRKHTGPAHLAMIAGLSVYEMFGAQFAEWLGRIFTQAPENVLKTAVYLALVLIFPLLLYFRSSHGGLFGLLRVAEATLFAVLLTSLISGTIAEYFTFDALAYQISDWITNFEGPIVLIGVLSAYFDILMYHD